MATLVVVKPFRICPRWPLKNPKVGLTTISIYKILKIKTIVIDFLNFLKSCIIILTMSEVSGDLIKPQDINPKNIGLRPDVDTRTSLQRFLDNDKVKRLLNVLPASQGSLSETEVADLQRLETGNLTLEKIKGYANDRAEYQEWYRGVKLTSGKKARFKEAFRVKSYLDKGDYLSAARYFLEKAKVSYADTVVRAREAGIPIERLVKNYRDELNMHVGDITPDGGSAKNQVEGIYASKPNLVFDSDNFVMCLKEAAVLVREATGKKSLSSDTVDTKIEDASFDYAKYGIPHPRSSEMPAFAEQKLAEWNTRYTSENRYSQDAKIDDPVEKALVDYMKSTGGGYREALIKAIGDNPESVLTIQAVSQFLARKEFGITVPTFPLKIFRGLGKGQPISEVRLFAFDSYSTDINVAQGFGQEASLGELGHVFQTPGYVVEMELPTENIFTYYGAHPAFRSTTEEMGRMPQFEIISNARDGVGASLINVYHSNDLTPLSGEEIAAFKKANPHWFEATEPANPNEVLSMREVSEGLAYNRGLLRSIEAEAEEARLNKPDQYKSWFVPRITQYTANLKKFEVEAREKYPQLLISDTAQEVEVATSGTV